MEVGNGMGIQQKLTPSVHTSTEYAPFTNMKCNTTAQGSQMPYPDSTEDLTVFPEPVCAHAMTSRPARMIGMAYFWMGVGFM